MTIYPVLPDLTRGLEANQVFNLFSGGGIVALTGAGMSTDSGIPDYRGPLAAARKPMTGTEFRSGNDARRRYWARSHLGWHRMGFAEPNRGHLAMAGLQQIGMIDAVITQNVDGLHQRAGGTDVVDLHGRIDEVICLNCGAISNRSELHARLALANPGFGAGLDIGMAPDGDVDLDDTSGFVIVPCEACGGILKPNVVFFGENVLPDKVQRCYDLVASARGMLVVGSSLTVMSGLRFVRRGVQLGLPIVIVNRGSTRGDELATLKLEEGCSEFLDDLLGRLRQPTV